MDSPDTPAVYASRLAKRYGPLAAVDGVDLELRRGEILGFVGPNGAGKSTFLKLLVGLVRPTAGSATVLGLDVVRRSAAVRQRVGYLPGDLGLYKNLRGGDVLEFLLSFHRRADKAKALRLCERMELPLKKKVKTWSTGMRQKLGIAQAFSTGAEVLLLDEPTHSLDPTTRAAFLDLLQDERAAGASILLSSHILGEVDRACDRIVFIDRGRLVPTGRIEAARAAFRRRLGVELAAGATEEQLRIDGVRVVERRDREFVLEVDGPLGPVLARLAELGLEAVDYNRPSLEDVYRLLYLDGGARATEGRP